MTATIAVILGLLGGGGLLGLLDRFFPDPPAPANVDAELTCNQDRIVIRVGNRGGVTATIDRPSFRIYADGVWDELPIRDFVPVDPNDDSKYVIAPGSYSVLSYPRMPPFDYFSAEQTGLDEHGRPNCLIAATIPGLTRGGERQCQCVYRS